MGLYQEIAEKHAAGQAFVVATIIGTKGSSPRQVGAKMLVYPDGSISGTIGGGYFEKLVIEDSVGLLLGEKRHLVKSYRFEKSDRPDATGMSCGGRAEVFLEAHSAPERLVIFGGGHIGQALAGLARKLNFTITVVDERQEILDNFHPPVESVLAAPGFTGNLPRVGPDCYLVIVTHGHLGDLAVLERVIVANCAYYGMIGSKAKIAKVYAELKKKGIDHSMTEQIHAPIGLDIGAEGPYEIAISIIAEIIDTRKKRRQKPS